MPRDTHVFLNVKYRLNCVQAARLDLHSHLAIWRDLLVHLVSLFTHSGQAMSGSKKWPEVKAAAGYRKTTTSNNAGPTATAESAATLDPLANPFLASGGTALESQKGQLKKAQTVDKSKPVVRAEHDGEDRGATKASAVLDAQKGQLKKAETVDKSKPIMKGEQDKDAEVLF